ncbi:hypothetical protein GCM10029976_080380 [Kribbella albertanoniae]
MRVQGVSVANPHGEPERAMSKTRNVRRRQLRRWALRYWAVARRNGMGPEGEDPRGVSYVEPHCVIAYEAHGPVYGKPTTRQWKAAERRIRNGHGRAKAADHN